MRYPPKLRGILTVAITVSACSGGASIGPTDGAVCNASAQAVTPSASAGACQPLQITAGVCNVENTGFAADQYVWYDDQCLQRTAEMVPNNAMDPEGAWGGFMRRYTYVVQGAIRDCAGTGSETAGFGWLVNHYAQGVADSRWFRGDSTQTLLAGKHHAIHQYTWSYAVDGYPMHATVQWLFATGRAHPLWAVTFDTSQAPRDAISADTRAPYGDFAWDGGAGANIDGVGWGDRNKFVTLDSPLSLASGWDYSAPNTIPYVRAWTAAGADAEMGSVQTQNYMEHDGGGFGFYSSRGTTNGGGPMPSITNWPYQIDQYSLPNAVDKKLAWGTNYGAVGQTSYPSYGNDRQLVGYPFQSYSVHIVLGTHGSDPVLNVVTQEEGNQGASLKASNATVDTSGPAGVGRTDTQTFTPVGYNPVYGTWDVHAQTTPVTLVLDPNGATLHHPMFVVHNWTGSDPNVALNGNTLAPDTGFYATVDSAQRNLWLTLPNDVAATATVLIQ